MPRPALSRPCAALLSAALLAATTPSAFAMSNQAFLKKAIQGDNSEIQLGMLAEQMGGSAAVKSLGSMLQGDHSQHRIKAVRLADQMGMTAPTSPTPEASAEMRKLRQMNRATFDREFANYTVKDHQKDIAAYKAEAQSAAGPVGKFARMTLPTLEKHLTMAERAAKRS